VADGQPRGATGEAAVSEQGADLAQALALPVVLVVALLAYWLIDDTPVSASAVRNAAASASSAGPAPAAAGSASAIRDWRPVAATEGAEIQAALQASNGNKSRAAQALGLTLRQLSYRISKLNLG